MRSGYVCMARCEVSQVALEVAMSRCKVHARIMSNRQIMGNGCC